MGLETELLQTILGRASGSGISQLQLAERAALRPETISRAKKRGTIDLKSLDAMARAIGMRLQLVPAEPAVPPSGDLPNRQSPLADPKFGLAWSNRNASAEALVISAIRSGNYHLLLEAAAAHGMPLVRRQLKVIGPKLRPAAREEVERQLRNIERGFADAQA